MRNKFLPILAILLLSSCQTTPPPASTPQQESVTLETQTLPASDLEIIKKQYYVIMYDKNYRLARAVIYTLTDDIIKKSNPGTRKDAFHQDPYLKKHKLPLVKDTEYKGTPYQRGHLANSADFTITPEANRETFTFANMVPMLPKLNEEAWGNLEDQVRLWACGEKKITVITGPVLRSGLQVISTKSTLSVPQNFYKIVLDETPPKKMLAFVYTQDDNKETKMTDRLVSEVNLKRKVLHQMDQKAFNEYPVEDIGSWKSENCVPKKSQRTIHK